jgi:hypothetical protein
MPRPAVRTDRTDCPRCLARVILARGVPPDGWALSVSSPAIFAHGPAAKVTGPRLPKWLSGWAKGGK